MEIEKILSDEEIELMIQNTNASMAMSGFEPADFSNELFREYAKGKITKEECIKKIKEYVMKK